MDHIEGGAVLPITEFWLGSGRGAHTAEQKGRPVSQADLDATNILGLTGWRINRAVFKTARSAFDLGHPSMGFDAAVPPMIPDRLTREEFNALGPEGCRDVTVSRAEARERLASWKSLVRSTEDLLGATGGDLEHEHLFIAWGHDSRLRRYARTSGGPSPQGSGLAKALLMFDSGKALGHRGIYWLGVRAATAAGMDKLDLDDRVAWASERTDDIRSWAREPLLYDGWWNSGKINDDGSIKLTDDPWGLLATAFEINEALSLPDPETYLSRLPVQVDGTCNGLQHLSALGLDPRGSKSTNLTRAKERNDIYAEVAATVSDMVTRDATDTASENHAVAQEWVGKVSRNTVKRGVMTTNYGVTKRGMRDQLVDGGDCPGDDKRAVSEAAGYMRDCMWLAIGEVAVAAREIMDWLQKVATELGNAGLPFRWVTPMGSTVQQAYRPWVTVRPITALGQITVACSQDRTGLKVRKGALAAAPNFVHSFDAAHMAKTIIVATARGITHFSMIHDSYGTHAADMDTLNAALRETFVQIYREDWMAKTYDFIRGYAGSTVDITPPPQRGTFDIEEVRESPWFFA